MGGESGRIEAKKAREGERGGGAAASAFTERASCRQCRRPTCSSPWPSAPPLRAAHRSPHPPAPPRGERRRCARRARETSARRGAPARPSTGRRARERRDRRATRRRWPGVPTRRAHAREAGWRGRMRARRIRGLAPEVAASLLRREHSRKRRKPQRHARLAKLSPEEARRTLERRDPGPLPHVSPTAWAQAIECHT